MSDEQQQVCPPDVCPKGHRIYWFSASNWAELGPRWWGVCSGKRIGNRVEVSGACRHTWFFGAGKLEAIDGFNSEILLRTVRDLAHQLGVFEAHSVDRED